MGAITAELVGVELSDVAAPAATTLRGARWQSTALRGCRLTGLALPEAALRVVDLTGCRWELGSLRHATLEAVVFRDCSLRELDLTGATLRACAFEGCDLSQSDWRAAHCVRGVRLVGCTLDGLRGVEGLAGARLPPADIVGLAPQLAAHLGLRVLEG